LRSIVFQTTQKQPSALQRKTWLKVLGRTYGAVQLAHIKPNVHNIPFGASVGGAPTGHAS
jgi:hypothetical protein